MQADLKMSKRSKYFSLQASSRCSIHVGTAEALLFFASNWSPSELSDVRSLSTKEELTKEELRKAGSLPPHMPDLFMTSETWSKWQRSLTAMFLRLSNVSF